MVDGRQGGIGAEVDLVLPRAPLVAGAFGGDAHLLQCQTDLPPDVLPPVGRGHVQVPRPVVGGEGGTSRLVGGKEVELALYPHPHPIAPVPERPGRLRQDAAAIPGEVLPGGGAQVTVKARHPPLGRAPGKQCQGVRIREEEQVGTGQLAKAGDGGGVKRHSPEKGPLQLGGKDGDILLDTEEVTEGEADKLYVVLLHKLHCFRCGDGHGLPSCCDDSKAARAGAFPPPGRGPPVNAASGKKGACGKGTPLGDALRRRLCPVTDYTTLAGGCQAFCGERRSIHAGRFPRHHSRSGGSWDRKSWQRRPALARWRLKWPRLFPTPPSAKRAAVFSSSSSTGRTGESGVSFSSRQSW